jgi:hypothetical protein
VLRQREVNRSRVAALNHEPVIGTVPGVAVWIFRKRYGGRDVRAGVFLVMENLRQLIKINLVAGENRLFYWSLRNELWCNRFFHRAQIDSLHLLGLGIDRRCQSRATGMKVG